MMRLVSERIEKKLPINPEAIVDEILQVRRTILESRKLESRAN